MILACLRNLLLRRDRENGFALNVKSLTLQRGEFVAITGPSGCGKSTALDLLGMILKPNSIGTFEYGFSDTLTDIKSMWNSNRGDELAELRKKNIGYVLQTGELFPFLNLEENIELTAKIAGRTDYSQRVTELMESLNIAHLAKSMPNEISVGERQRVAIARALASAPKLLLADEPTAALDPGLARTVMKLFLETAGKTDTTIVMVSHDVNLVHEFSFREISVILKTEGNSTLSVLDDGLF
jgi:putative ABC transport system ATP-binding protein